MRRLHLAVATVFILASAGTAQAQIGVTAETYQSYFIGNAEGSDRDQGSNGLIGSMAYAGMPTNGGGYSSLVNITDSTIIFKSDGAVTSASFGSFYSESLVTLTVENGGVGTLQNPQLSSTITPASMGFYIADMTPGCGITSCIENLGTNFNQLVPNFGESSVVAGASFNFDIYLDGDSRNPIYSLTGIVELAQEEGGLFPSYNVFGSQNGLPIDQQNAGLNGFIQQTNRGSAYTFAWDETDILLSIGDILAGQSRNITYSTRVNSYSNAGCTATITTACLIAYAGFGDPIGRGGDAEAEALTAASFAFSQDDGPVLFAEEVDQITGLDFGFLTYERPTLVNGNISFGLNNVTYASAAVPEPATWAMLIMGFGALGAAMRRRRAFVCA